MQVEQSDKVFGVQRMTIREVSTINKSIPVSYTHLTLPTILRV